jgi:hypothetical protein
MSDMKAIDSVAYLVCAGVLMVGGAGSPRPHVNAQSAQSQSQTDARVRQLQSQPPKMNTDQEWRAAVQFMQSNCPNRITFVMTQLQNRPMQFERAKELILKQYLRIANTKDPLIQKVAVRQAQIQDNVFGLQMKIKNAGPRPDPRDMMKWQNDLKIEMDQLVNVQIALREVHITHLQAEIERFKTNRQEYVNSWLKDELKKATASNLDVSGHDTGDAIIDEDNKSTTPPPAPPVKK